jgi:uncharacterized protein YjbI with pentapeptide repeats
MANKEHLKILEQGVEVWNEWRKDHPDTEPNFVEAYLRKANLAEVDLSAANLTNADLRGATLIGAILVRSDLSHAKLIETNLCDTVLSRAVLSAADLAGASLRMASLRDADLTGADLRSVDLSEADLSNANLDKAAIGWTLFGNIDLSTVKNLVTINHHGPSTVGIDTIYRSQGKIPDSFLRGCGLTELDIEYAKLAKPNLTPAEITDAGYKLIELRSDQRPLEFYSCFISYSQLDESFTRQLHDRMQKEKLKTWYAPEDIQGGHKLYEQIDRALSLQEKFLIVLSENSMHSEWVKTELYKARQREINEKCRILFPIRLVDYETIRNWECFDADSGKDLAREVREYYIPDFFNWQNDGAFEEAFQKLLRDLTKDDA